jgi:capsular polysaccharide biosynthesis protein
VYLSQFAALVRGWWWLVVIPAVIAGAVAFTVSSSLLPQQYSSESEILVGSLTETSTDQLAAYQQLAQTYAALATSTPVLARVADRLGLDADQKLPGRIDVRAQSGPAIVKIVATALSPAEAKQLAEAVADEIVLLAKPAAGQPSLGSIFQPALLPVSPSEPRVGLNTLLGAGIGFALGIGLISLLAGRREPPRLRRPGFLRRASRPAATPKSGDVLVDWATTPLRNVAAPSTQPDPRAAAPSPPVTGAATRGLLVATPWPGGRSMNGRDPLEASDGPTVKVAPDATVHDFKKAMPS